MNGELGGVVVDDVSFVGVGFGAEGCEGVAKTMPKMAPMPVPPETISSSSIVSSRIPVMSIPRFLEAGPFLPPVITLVVQESDVPVQKGTDLFPKGTTEIKPT